MICCDKNESEILCEYCGRFYQDNLVHFACNCYRFKDIQDIFWQHLIDHFDVAISVQLFSLDDEHLIDCLLGAPIGVDINEFEENKLAIHCFNYICSLNCF